MDETIQFDTYRAGVLGEITAWHGRYYTAHWGFGPYFEAKVASDLAEFSHRMKEAGCLLLTAWQDEIFLGSISVDKDVDPSANLAHIRWFIMSDHARGKKIGRQLLNKSLQFIRDQGYQGAYLTTFKGLDAATKLYSDFGFTMIEEAEGLTWGAPVTEQKYELIF